MGCCFRKYRLLRLKIQKNWMMFVWVALCTGVFYKDYMCYKLEPQYYYLRRMLGVGMCISRGTAAVLNLSCCVLVIPMCRALATDLSSAFRFFSSHFHWGPPLEGRIPAVPAPLTRQASQTAKSIHIMLAVTVMLCSVVHTCAHISNAINFSRYYNQQYPEINAASFRDESPLHLFVATVPGLTGVAMMVILSLLAITSTKCARKRNYDTFFYTHYLGVIFFGLLLVHPLSGVIKEQKNLRGHIPGCQMYRSSDEIEEGFPEPEPLDYFEITANEFISSEYEGIPYHRSNGVEKDKQRDLEGGYPESESTEVGTFEGRGDGSKEEEAAKGVGVRIYVKRKICSEGPVFRAIHTQTWIWISVALVLWTANSTLRWWRQRADVHVVNVVHYPCDVVQLTLQQSGFSCTPGQYVLIQCPAVSRFEWHPFTVTCPPTEHKADMFTVLIRARGDWSSKVASLLRTYSDSSHRLPYDSQPNDTFPLYCPAAKESSLRCNTSSNNSSSHTIQMQNTPKQDTYRHLKCDRGFYCLAHPHTPAVEAPKSYSFSLGVSEKKFNNSLFCRICNCNHTKPLISDLSEIEGKTHSLPIDHLITRIHSNKLQGNISSNRSLTYSQRLRYNTHSNCCVQKCLDWKQQHCKSCMHNNKRHNDVQSANGSNTDFHLHSQGSLDLHLDNTAKQQRKEKRYYRINVNSPCYPRLLVDGPYSSPSEEMLHYPVIIGAAGGVGITPLAATLSHKLWHPAMWPRRIHMVWVVRDARLLLVIAPLLTSLLLQLWQTDMEDCIELRLHVTIPTTQQALQDLFANDYPSLLPRISQGRPHWKHLFQEWRQIYTRKKVGVFTCGPPKMCRQVKRHCLQAVSRGAHFSYHQESFS